MTRNALVSITRHRFFEQPLASMQPGCFLSENEINKEKATHPAQQILLSVAVFVTSAQHQLVKRGKVANLGSRELEKSLSR